MDEQKKIDEPMFDKAKIAQAVESLREVIGGGYDAMRQDADRAASQILRFELIEGEEDAEKVREELLGVFRQGYYAGHAHSATVFARLLDGLSKDEFERVLRMTLVVASGIGELERRQRSVEAGIEASSRADC